MKTSLAILAVSLPAAFLVACAAEPSVPSTTASQAAAPSDVICGREYMTGSNIATTKCRTREQAEAERAAAERGLGRSTGGASGKPGGGS